MPKSKAKDGGRGRLAMIPVIGGAGRKTVEKLFTERCRSGMIGPSDGWLQVGRCGCSL